MNRGDTRTWFPVFLSFSAPARSAIVRIALCADKSFLPHMFSIVQRMFMMHWDRLQEEKEINVWNRTILQEINEWNRQFYRYSNKFILVKRQKKALLFHIILYYFSMKIKIYHERWRQKKKKVEQEIWYCNTLVFLLPMSVIVHRSGYRL